MLELIIISVVCFITALLGAISGFGQSSIMIPTLSLFLPFRETILLVGIIHWVTSIFIIILFRKGINWKLLLAFGIPGAFMSYFGALLISHAQSAFALQILGGFIIAYVLLLLFAPSFKIKHSFIPSIIGGTLAGFAAGIFGIRGAIRSIFLSAYNLPKRMYIATGGAIVFVVDTVRLRTYLYGGMKLPTNLWAGLIIFLPLTLLGVYSARFIVDKIPQQYFRNVIALFLFVLGIKLLIFQW